MNSENSSVNQFIENNIIIKPGEKFTAIIGANPSQGARSPLLWNEAYKQYGIDIKMYPFDVLPKNLNNLLTFLNRSKNFLGGAIAVPYKEDVAKWLQNRLSKEVCNIGAVNCIAKIQDEKLWGYNTDGEAAIYTFEKKFGSISNKSILVLGCGGTAKAVSAFFKKSLTDGDITIASRNKEGEEYSKKISVNWINWSNISNILPKINILINCTTLGYSDKQDQSPLSYEQLSLLPNDSIIFDVIYQPSSNLLSTFANSLKINLINGSEMNIEQAVIAFNIVNKDVCINPDFTKKAMLDSLK